MPYSLIPEGFTLKKVTKAQEKAVEELRKHDDFKSFLSSNSSGTALTVLSVGTIAFILLLPLIWFWLKDGDEGGTWGDYLATEPTFWGIYAKAGAGIPITLQNVILPQPVREEIKARTGLDLDIASQFAKIQQMEVELRRREEEEKAQS